jgi:hypothetical protein
MARPMYETEEDLAREREIIKRLCNAWRCEAAKLPIKYALDYALIRDEQIIAWCEVRDRSGGRGWSFDELDEMGGYMLSLAKWDMARTLSYLSHLPFTLVVKCTDATRAATFSHGNFLPYRPSMAGRTFESRGDWQDVEPCVFIPIENFDRVIK